jgi:hypothetical protein
MKIECILLDAGNKCNICNLRSRCFKIWKYAAFNLSQDYRKALEHITELKDENKTLRIRVEELADLATIRILEDLGNEKQFKI